MLYSDQIETLLSKDLITKKHFQGVYASDQIPVLKKNSYIILNSDPQYELGEHWVVLSRVNDIFEFFDPLGRSPAEYDFKNFPTQYSTLYNLNCIQNPLQNLCGYYCIYFAYFKSRGCKLSDIIDHFSENLHANDLYIKLKIKYLFNIQPQS